MFRYFCVILLLIILFSCTKKNNTERQYFLIQKSFDEYSKTLPQRKIIYRERSNEKINSNHAFLFLNAKDLLEKNDENFFLLSYSELEKDTISVIIFSFKAGKLISCKFDKNNALIKKRVEMIKPMESKPYYIYFEILKRKYPHYMNWEMFPIPQDSLR